MFRATYKAMSEHTAATPSIYPGKYLVGRVLVQISQRPLPFSGDILCSFGYFFLCVAYRNLWPYLTTKNNYENGHSNFFIFSFLHL
jgi:hypothetical protein